MRKEPGADCVTPSNNLGLKEGHGIPHGEGLDIWQTLEKLKYNCWCFRITIISHRMSQHAIGLIAQLSEIVEKSPSPYWDLLVVCRDGTVRWGNTENQPRDKFIYFLNFRQNKAMLIVAFPFLREYSSILDTSLDNMTLFLPDFTMSDLQTAVRKPFLPNQTHLTGYKGQDSTGKVCSQRPAG